jgi:uncharacterized protein (TIGR00266 family)
VPHIDIGYRPAHSLARVSLQPGESIVAESGAMVGMSTNVQMQTQSGGMMSGLKRLFGGESFFRNTFTAHGGPGEVLFAQPLCGDMATLTLTPSGYYIQNSAYIASTPDVQVATETGGFRGFFSGAGVFILKATSQSPGQVIVGGFGGLQELQCRDDLVIDTGHLVAWDATLQYTIGKSGSGWLASYLSGEGLVCHFRGQGRIWIQSRNATEYGQAIGALLPPRSA